MELYRYGVIAITSFSSAAALGGCVANADTSRNTQQVTVAEEAAIDSASSTVADPPYATNVQEALNAKGDWQFAQCCRITLPSDANAFPGPSTIDGPSTYVIRRDDTAVSITISSGPLAVPAGGELQQSNAGIPFRRYVKDGGETAVFAADKVRASSPLDKKTVTFTATDQTSVVLLRDLTRTMVLVSSYESDRERQ